MHKLLAIAILFGAMNIAESANCQTCTNKFDENFPAVKEALKQAGPVIAHYTLTVNPCKLSGFESMVRVPDKQLCPRNLQNGNIATDFYLSIPNVTLECDVNVNLPNILKYAQKINGAIKRCSAASFLEAIQTTLVVPPPPLTLAEVGKFNECQNILKAILIKMELNGKFVAAWPDVLVRATLTSPPVSSNGKVRVSDIVIMNEDISGCHVDCSGDEEFRDVCSCFMSNNFLRYLVVKSVQLQIACNAEQEYPKYQNYIDKLNCNE